MPNPPASIYRPDHLAIGDAAFARTLTPRPLHYLQPKALMDHRVSNPLLTEDAFLAGVSTIARQFARMLLSRADADDLAQDVVLDCLGTLRDGTQHVPTRRSPGCVQGMVLTRLVDAVCPNERREWLDAEYERDRADCARVWMSPDLAVEALEDTEAHAKILASLVRAQRFLEEHTPTWDRSLRRAGTVSGSADVPVTADEPTLERTLGALIRELATASSRDRGARSTGLSHMSRHEPRRPANVARSPKWPGCMTLGRPDVARGPPSGMTSRAPTMRRGESVMRRRSITYETR